MPRAYFGSRISDHILKTPEGFLVCKDVPIARTGIQEYRGAEFGAQDSERVYDVQRPESEVFDRAAVASFEGKPVCDEHPPEDVTPDNFTRYIKGVCRDVRRGDGDLRNCLVADLLIYDADLIKKIEGGKREISCGYDCLWNPTGDASYDQLEIRGNHVAVVDKGRAGHKVAIRDTAKNQKGGRKMSKSLFGRILKALALDADTTPEDMEAAAKLAGGADATPHAAPAAPNAPAPVAQPAAPAPQPAPEKSTVDADLDARLSKIEDAIAALSAPKHQEAPKPEPDALDALEEELQQPAPTSDEDDVVEAPEEINAQDAVEEPEAEAENAPVPASAEARDAAMAIIRSLRPAIASLPAAKRKRAADSLAVLIKGNMAYDSQYGELLNIRRNNAKARAMDSSVDDGELGRAIRDKYNPHYKKN